MIYYILLVVSIILAVLKSSVYNTYAKTEKPDIKGVFMFNAFSYGVAALIALVVFLFGETSISLVTVFCALGYAVIVFSLQSLSIVAMRTGEMSLTSLIILYGMIIPSLAGPIFWSEPFGILQGVGIVAMIVSLWLLSDKTDGKNKITKKWIIIVALCFLLSGFAGVMEKIHQSTSAKAEKTSFILCACLCMLVFSLSGVLAVRKKSQNEVNIKKLSLLGSSSGVIVGLYSSVNLTLAGALNSMIYYPVANGGALLLTVVVSFLVFKEKLSKSKIIGFIIGLLAIVTLSLPV